MFGELFANILKQLNKFRELISLLKDKFSEKLIHKTYVFLLLQLHVNNRHVKLSKRNEHIKTRRKKTPFRTKNQFRLINYFQKYLIKTSFKQNYSIYGK